MAELPISAVDAGDEIRTLILKEGIEKLTSKSIRKHLQGKFDIDLSEHKAEIDRITFEKIQEIKADQEKKAATTKRARSPSDDSDSDVEDMASAVKRRRSGPTRRKQPAKKKEKPAKKEKKPGPKKQTAFTRICVLSDELSAVLGKQYMRRSDVVKAMWAYFRNHDLQDPKDRRMVILDEPLRKIFNNKRIQAFGMMRGLKTHIKDAEFLDDETRRRVEEDLEKESTTNGEAGGSKDKTKVSSGDDSSDDDEPKSAASNNLSSANDDANGSASSSSPRNESPKVTASGNGETKKASSSDSGSSSSESGSSSSSSSSDNEE